MSEPEKPASNPRTGKPGDSISSVPQGAWDPEKISRDIEAARRKQNPEEAAGEDYPLGNYIRDCAEEWGMREEDVENNLGLDKD
jgi:hypothetical protein